MQSLCLQSLGRICWSKDNNDPDLHSAGAWFESRPKHQFSCGSSALLENFGIVLRLGDDRFLQILFSSSFINHHTTWRYVVSILKASLKRRRLHDSQRRESKIWSWDPSDSEPIMTVLARTSSNWPDRPSLNKPQNKVNPISYLNQTPVLPCAARISNERKKMITPDVSAINYCYAFCVRGRQINSRSCVLVRACLFVRSMFLLQNQ
jgi:hypothetical protein